ncbi:putative casein kinase II, alpha chain, partial [Trypanosoma theileri]
MSTTLLVTEEEKEVISVSSEALLHLAARLNGAVFSPHSIPTTTGTVNTTTITRPPTTTTTNINTSNINTSTNTSNMNISNPPFVTIEDGVGFVELLSEVVVHYATALKPTSETPQHLQPSLYREEISYSHSHHHSTNTTVEMRRSLRMKRMALRYLLFEVQPDLMATVLSILHAPHIMEEEDEMCRLFCRVLAFLQGVVLSCCIPSEETFESTQQQRKQKEEEVEKGEEMRDVGLPMEAIELAATTTDLLDRLGAVHIITGLLFDEYPTTVRLAAVQLLFVLLLRDGGAVAQTRNPYVRDSLTTAEHLSILLSVLSTTPSSSSSSVFFSSSSQSPLSFSPATGSTSCIMMMDKLVSLRLHAAACLRELANTHFIPLAQPEVLDVFRCIADTDVNGDLRALCIESLHVILQRNTSIACWANIPFKKELVAFCSRQLERESHPDALRATMCLVETLIVKDAILTSILVQTGNKDRVGRMFNNNNNNNNNNN